MRITGGSYHDKFRRSFGSHGPQASCESKIGAGGVADEADVQVPSGPRTRPLINDDGIPLSLIKMGGLVNPGSHFRKLRNNFFG